MFFSPFHNGDFQLLILPGLSAWTQNSSARRTCFLAFSLAATGINICMYVYIYIYMCVCVCMYVWMYVCMNVWIVWMYECMYIIYMLHMHTSLSLSLSRSCPLEQNLLVASPSPNCENQVRSSSQDGEQESPFPRQPEMYCQEGGGLLCYRKDHGKANSSDIPNGKKEQTASLWGQASKKPFLSAWGSFGTAPGPHWNPNAISVRHCIVCPVPYKKVLLQHV